MPTTGVLIHDELGLRVPSVPSVPILSGNGITFTAADGADSALYFSPPAAAILTPSPVSPVSLASGATVEYAFASASAGAYGVIVRAPDSPPPSEYDFGGAADPPVLVIQAGEGTSFPGPTVPIKTG